MYIRKKKVKGNTYAYLVRAEWTSKGPRQRVSQYLGRVVRLAKIKDVAVDVLNCSSREDCIAKLVELELVQAGFAWKGNVLVKGDVTFDMAKLEASTSTNVAIVLEMNEGFMCRHTLEALRNFEEKGPEVGLKLATLFVQAGFGISKEMFVKIYERYYAERRD